MEESEGIVPRILAVRSERMLLSNEMGPQPFPDSAFQGLVISRAPRCQVT
jgi:hypothetical protein